MSREEFSPSVKKEALKRQGSRCGACAVRLFDLGEANAPWHVFGERSEAHHIRHAQVGGAGTVDNCIILCRACHYSVHGGGAFGDDGEDLQGEPKDYICYRGHAAKCQSEGEAMDRRFRRRTTAP